MSHWRHLLAIVLALAVFHGQAGAVVSQFTIKVLEGEGAFNNIRRRVGRNVRILVQDQNGAPVPGAHVVFIAPVVGAGVTFGASGNKLETRTDVDGTATAPVTPNTYEGSYAIKVVVSSGGAEHTRLVRQSNTNAGGIEDPTEKRSGRRALLLAILGGGAAAGVAFALKGRGGSTPAAGPSVISVGGISVGGPR